MADGFRNDVKPFPKSEKFQGADVLIIGNTIIGEQYGIKRVIITHLEEDWGKSYDDYRELERELNLIYFAYDGMKIRL